MKKTIDNISTIMKLHLKDTLLNLDLFIITIQLMHRMPMLMAKNAKRI